jgi:hypothetical protein
VDEDDEAMAVSKRTWASVLFYVVAAVTAVALVQQWTGVGGANGDRYARTLAFVIPMAFPVGMAWWGKKTGQVGPAFGALSLIALLWVALLMGG